MREVFRGRSVGGLHWSIEAGEVEGKGFMTLVRREQEDRSVSSGMGGPKLWQDEPLNTFFGQEDGTPPFVLARADPSVVAVTVHGDRGGEYTLSVSPTVEEFGLRFAAGPLAEGEQPVIFEARLENGELWRKGVPWSRRQRTSPKAHGNNSTA